MAHYLLNLVCMEFVQYGHCHSSVTQCRQKGYAPAAHVSAADGNPVTEEIVTEFDNSEYTMSGVIRDNRNGTVTIKMGKLTEIESILSELESEVK